MSTQTRQPSGVPTGGQFAASARTEPSLTLAAPAPTPVLDRIDEDILDTAASVKRAQQVRATPSNDHYAASQALRRYTERAKTEREYATPPTPEQQAEIDRLTQAKIERGAYLAEAGEAVAAAKAHQAEVVGRYPWAGTDIPVVNLHEGIQRPQELSPSGQFGFYVVPAALTSFSRPAVRLASKVGDRWWPQGAAWSTDHIASLHPGESLVADSNGPDQRLLPAEDVSAFIAFARGTNDQEVAA